MIINAGIYIMAEPFTIGDWRNSMNEKIL